MNSHSFILFTINITSRLFCQTHRGKKVRLCLFTSLIKREVSRHLHAVVVKWWQRNVDKTIRCKCKVVDLLIKLIEWPFCASQIRRRSWLAVVSSTLSQFSVAFYVLRTPVYIRNRIAKYMHFILFWPSLQISEGSFFDHEPQISVSKKLSTTPKWNIQPNIPAKYSWRERGFHKGYYLTKWCE